MRRDRISAGLGTMTDPVNILLVDDNPQNLTVLESVLDSPEYRLTKAQSGQEALLALVAADYALIVLDVRMPEITSRQRRPLSVRQDWVSSRTISTKESICRTGARKSCDTE